MRMSRETESCRMTSQWNRTDFKTQGSKRVKREGRRPVGRAPWWMLEMRRV